MTTLTDSVRMQAPARVSVEPAAPLDPPAFSTSRRTRRRRYGYSLFTHAGVGSYRSWERAVGAARWVAEDTKVDVQMVNQDSGEMWNVSPDGGVRNDRPRSSRVPKAAAFDAEMDRRADGLHPRLRMSAAGLGSTRRFSSFAALKGLQV